MSKITKRDLAVLGKAFEEDKHPRDSNGRFGSGGGGEEKRGPNGTGERRLPGERQLPRTWQKGALQDMAKPFRGELSVAQQKHASTEVGKHLDDSLGAVRDDDLTTAGNVADRC